MNDSTLKVFVVSHLDDVRDHVADFGIGRLDLFMCGSILVINGNFSAITFDEVLDIRERWRKQGYHGVALGTFCAETGAHPIRGPIEEVSELRKAYIATVEDATR
jgi:hypothetical protein